MSSCEQGQKRNAPLLSETPQEGDTRLYKNITRYTPEKRDWQIILVSNSAAAHIFVEAGHARAESLDQKRGETTRAS